MTNAEKAERERGRGREREGEGERERERNKEKYQLHYSRQRRKTALHSNFYIAGLVTSGFLPYATDSVFHQF